MFIIYINAPETNIANIQRFYEIAIQMCRVLYFFYDFSQYVAIFI